MRKDKKNTTSQVFPMAFPEEEGKLLTKGIFLQTNGFQCSVHSSSRRHTASSCPKPNTYPLYNDIWFTCITVD